MHTRVNHTQRLPHTTTRACLHPTVPRSVSSGSTSSVCTPERHAGSGDAGAPVLSRHQQQGPAHPTPPSAPHESQQQTTQPLWFDATKHSASQLTRRITAAQSWQELEHIRQTHASQLDFIHLSAMLSRLAKIVCSTSTPPIELSPSHTSTQQDTATPPPSSTQPPLTPPFTPAQHNNTHTPHTRTAQHSTAEHATVPDAHKTEHPVPKAPPWPPNLQATHAHSTPFTSSHQQQHQDHPPPSSQQQQQQQQLDHNSTFSPTSNLQHDHPHPLHTALHLQQQVLAQADAIRPRETSNCLWALARMQQHWSQVTVQQPTGSNQHDSPSLVDPALLQLAWKQGQSMAPQELSSMLYATALLGWQPRGSPLYACLDRLYRTCHNAGPQALANSVWALGKLGVAPPPKLLRRLLWTSYNQMYDFTPQGLVCVAHGFTLMHTSRQQSLFIPKGWHLKLIHASWRYMWPQQQQHDLSSQQEDPSQGQNSLHSSSLQQQQQHRQEQHDAMSSDAEGSLMNATSHTASQPVHASTLVRLLWCLVKGGARPSKPWLASCFSQVDHQADSLQAIDIANALWALGQLRTRPPPHLLAKLMARAYTHMGELPIEGLVCVLWAAAQLGARPSSVWAERFLRLVFRSRDCLTPRLVSTTLLSLVRLRLRPNKRFVHGLLLSLPAEPDALVAVAGRAETVQLGMALPALGHGLPAEMVPAFQQLVDVRLPQLKNEHARAVAAKGWADVGLRVEAAGEEQ